MNENEILAYAMHKARMDIAGILHGLELATGQTVLNLEIDSVCVSTMPGESKSMRTIRVELSEKPGREWGVCLLEHFGD